MSTNDLPSVYDPGNYPAGVPLHLFHLPTHEFPQRPPFSQKDQVAAGQLARLVKLNINTLRSSLKPPIPDMLDARIMTTHLSALSQFYKKIENFLKAIQPQPAQHRQTRAPSAPMPGPLDKAPSTRSHTIILSSINENATDREPKKPVNPNVEARRKREQSLKKLGINMSDFEHRKLLQKQINDAAGGFTPDENDSELSADESPPPSPNGTATSKRKL